MKYFRLKIITESLSSKNKAIKLAEKIKEILKLKIDFKIEIYHKFEDSYEIEFYDELYNTDIFIAKSIKMTAKICSPWSTTYHDNSGEIELIFNKETSSLFQNPNFNTIKWAIFTVETV